jgi:hypothetical protein
MEFSLCGGDVIIVLELAISKNDVQHNVKHKLDFDELNFISKQKTTSTFQS